MRIAVVLRAIVAAVGVVGVVGCGTTVDGAATTSTSSGGADGTELFNPCSEVPDEWLRETGLDPATKTVTTDPQDESAWRICGWYAVDGPYRVDIMSTSHTQAESRANEKLTGFREVAIGSRLGLIYKDKSDNLDLSCYVSLPAQQGMFEIAVGWRASQPVTADRCELAVEHAKDLEPHLPR